MKRIENHVAPATGGGRGIGNAIAAWLYAEISKRTICGTTPKVLQRTVHKIVPNVLAITCDA